MNYDASVEDIREPLPDFSREDAIRKIRIAENAWNSREPLKVATAYSLDSQWRNRHEFFCGRREIIKFLEEKWKKENEYRLIKELWVYGTNRIAVRFVYEWRDISGQWFRSHGNENWAFNQNGLMTERHASINDLPIKEAERKFRWMLGPRPEEHPGLTQLGL